MEVTRRIGIPNHRLRIMRGLGVHLIHTEGLKTKRLHCSREEKEHKAKEKEHKAKETEYKGIPASKSMSTVGLQVQ